MIKKENERLVDKEKGNEKRLIKKGNERLVIKKEIKWHLIKKVNDGLVDKERREMKKTLLLKCKMLWNKNLKPCNLPTSNYWTSKNNFLDNIKNFWHLKNLKSNFF